MDKLRRNIRIITVIFAAMFVSLILYSAYSVSTYGSQWFSSPYNPRLSEQKRNIIAGSVLDRNGIKLAYSNDAGDRLYNDSKGLRLANAHVIGEQYAMVPGGAETIFGNYLYGFNTGVFERVYEGIAGGKRRGDDVYLTVDSELSKHIYDAMDGRRGAVVVMNYKTGEIISLVSLPAFDPSTIKPPKEGEQQQDNGELVNRVSQGRYTPGSVFKIITAASALKNIGGIEDRAFTCTGSVDFDGNILTDNNGESHGNETLLSAFTVSCNSYFGSLGVELGTRLRSTAEDFGFNKEMVFKDVLMRMSEYEYTAEKGHLAWSAVGQYKDTVSPLHMCLIAASVANGGDMMEPRLLKKVEGSQGFSTVTPSARVAASPLSKSQADTLKGLMRSVVKSGTGRSAAVDGVTVCGKTGTAEVGGANSHAWFVGFIEESDHPLAVAVVLENAGSGGRNAAPLAQRALSKAVGLGY
ncbi:MAG: penicillin-binding transpeptidase domain-containing protein [Christensenellales bacterium]|jgi:peptidoglycan glycosyltransferase